MTLLMSLLLGVVQGITEFLPVSSSGHLSILQNLLLLDYTEDEHLLFDVFLHLGTLISIIVVYRKEIKAMLSEALSYMRQRADNDAEEPVVMSPPARVLLFVIIGTIPMIIPMIFYNDVKRLFMSVAFIGFALIVTGGLLFVSDRYVKKGKKTEKTMSIADAIIVGLSQAVAVIPGLSRSGTTIAVSLARGFSPSFAVRFSLLLSIPAVFGATVVTLYSAIANGVDFSYFFVYIVGFVIAAAVGYFAIQFLRRIISKGGFSRTAYYCWALGAVAIILSFII